MSTTQTVYRLTIKDGIDGIHPYQEPIPSISPYEVLVKVHAVSLNYRDIAIATSKYLLPARNEVVPTSDMCGEVVEVGSLVTNLAVGDAVIPPVTPDYLYGDFREGDDAFGSVKDGMLREYVVLPAHILIKVRVGKGRLGYAEWASIVCTGATAWNSFYGGKKLAPGDTVFIQGTGGVSIASLVIAKAAGATTIISSSSDEKLKYVKSLGADHVVNYKTHPHWAAEVHRITNGRGVDHIIENGGLGTIEQSLECIAGSGIISVIGFLAEGGEKQPAVLIPTLIKAATVRGVRGGSKHQLEELVKFLGNKDVDVAVNKVFSFSKEGIVDAYKFVEAGKHIGKVVISLDKQ
ncbi:NAD(P)-binding protein [Periconia macrospinosa]|uniref:NAD(P)-binding protein n=1 Tax=Periconia macrospinosa TaxID=97972 RepID=A0A2V1E6B8_9PLEO|nr:NAD(P)-binding protein [Periconia macrospinosa]